MELRVKRISRDTFKIQADIAIDLRIEDMVPELRELERELADHKVWLKEAIRLVKEKIPGRPIKRLFSVEETAEYLGLSPRTLYNRIGQRAESPFPIKPKRIGKLVKFDVEDLESHIESLGR